MPQFLTSQTYGASANLVSPNCTGTPLAPTATAGTNTTQVATTAFVQNAALANRTLCQGRLTLVSGGPVTDGSGTTLYFTPFRGNLIGFNDGTLLVFAETSLAIPATTGVYDIFAYNNSGTLALEASAVWSTTGNLTAAAGTRNGYSLTLTNGIYYKSTDSTRRYIGTLYSSSGTCTDVTGGVGTAGKRQLWNYYNRTLKPVITSESAASWTYATNAWRAFNGNANGLSSIQVVLGVKEDLMRAMAAARVIPNTGGSIATGVGYDVTTAVSGFFASVSKDDTGLVFYDAFPDIGLHTYYGLENATAAVLCTLYANQNDTEIRAAFAC